MIHVHMKQIGNIEKNERKRQRVEIKSYYYFLVLSLSNLRMILLFPILVCIKCIISVLAVKK